MRNLGFGKKLYVSSLGIIVLTILIIAGVNFYQTRASFLANGKAGIQNVSDVLLKTLEVQYNLQREKMDSDLGMLTTETESAGKAMVINSRTTEMEVFDSQTREKKTLILPKLIFGLHFVTGEYGLVDKVGSFSDSEIAVYQLFEEKLIKVSTSTINEDKTRPVGEYFKPSALEYQSVMSQPEHRFFSGAGRNRTLNLLSPFIEPVDNTIAGAYSISTRILTQDLEDLVKKINVSGHGYACVFDGSGTILVHPDPAYTTLNIEEFKGGDEILKAKTGFISYGHDNRVYYGYVTYFKPWDLYFMVAVSQVELMQGINRQILISAGISAVIALIIGALIVGLMNRQLMNHMKGMATMAKEVAKGNFKHSFTYHAQDPIHDTVDSMNEMAGELAAMIRELNSGVETLGTSSGELNRISDQMTLGAETSVTKVNTVAAAAEQMSTNMDSVAAAMEQASTKLESVAIGTSQMSSSIEKVAHNSNHTREITSKAVEKARQTSDRVRQLGRAAEQINKVTETINTISSQTNLLALNATIEAARAGEAGKGFAVVATEIKALAGKTANATNDIALNIKEIQDQINGAVKEIQDISTIIHEINHFVKEAAEAIEIQAGTTNEISENISQVSLGIQEVTENVAQSSAVSSQVAHEISDVLTASQQISDFSSKVKEKSASLNGVMLQLKAMTQKFNI